jgi:methyl-accepting chemotaxis protein
MKLRDLRIGTRLGLNTAVLLAILVTTVALSTFLVEQNKRRLVQGLERANTKAALVATMKSAVLEGGIAMRNMLDVTSVSRQKVRVEEQKRRYAEAHAKLLAGGLDDTEKKVLETVANLDKEVEGRYKLAISQAENLNSEGAANIITRFVDPANMGVVAEMDKLVAMQDRNVRALIEASVSADRRLMWGLLGISTLALLLGVGLSWIITRSITRPLNEAVAVAGHVASGDLTSRIDDRHRDEVGQLFEALRQMNTSLGSIVSQVRTGTNTINSASTEIASGNADLSSRTEEQASSLQSTASSIEELTSTVKQNADNATQADKLASTACEVAIKGGAVVSQVVETMGSINDSSKKIVDIIGVIDGIAFQTNILALNAAVEAARAGEQGRGFAVVAAEVRNLAQRSAGAAKEIKALISNSVDKVDTGSRLVDQAGSTMNEVVASVRRVNDIISDIAAASREQTAGIEQVNEAISQMDHVTQQNAALVEQAAAAAASMQEQAHQLSAVVSVFKVHAEDALRTDPMPAMSAAAAGPALKAPMKPLVQPPKTKPVARLAPASRGNAEDWEEF